MRQKQAIPTVLWLVIVDTSGSYITTRNHKIEKSYKTSISPREGSSDLLIILITGAVAYGFLYMLALSIGGAGTW